MTDFIVPAFEFSQAIEEVRTCSLLGIFQLFPCAPRAAVQKQNTVISTSELRSPVAQDAVPLFIDWTLEGRASRRKKGRICRCTWGIRYVYICALCSSVH